MPKISIIIPVYNVEPYLRQALDSAVNQTLKDIEIICVDDCSTDNCLAILKEYAARDERIVLLEQEVNQGSGMARNRALDIAKGEVVMFLDPDDWYELNACEKAYNQITKNNNDYVYMNYCFYRETNGIWKFVSGDYHLDGFFEKEVINCPDIKLWELKNNFWHNVNTVCRAYRREFLEKHNIRYDNNLRLCQDVPFFAKCIANAQSVSVIMDELYIIRDRAGSSNKTAKNYECVIKSRRMACEIIEASNHAKDLEIPCLCYALSVLSHFNRLTEIDKKIEKDFYNKMRKFFLFLNKNENIDSIKDYTSSYITFKEIVETPYCIYKAKQYLWAICNDVRFKKIFSIETAEETKVIKRTITLFNSIKLKTKAKNTITQNYEKAVKNRIKVKLKNNKPINILFLSNKIENLDFNLYKKFKENKYFNPKVIVFPMTSVHANQDDTQPDLAAICDFYKKQGFDVECVYNQDKHFYRSIKRYSPDLIFYQALSDIPVKYRACSTRKYALRFLSESDKIFEYIENNIGKEVPNE